MGPADEVTRHVRTALLFDVPEYANVTLREHCGADALVKA